MAAKEFFQKHGPEMLFGLGIAGVVGSAVGAVIVTPKAVAEMNTKTEKWDKIKTCGKHYILPGLGMGLSITALVAVLVNKNKTISGLALAAAASEKLYVDYKDKVVEMIGERKEKEVQDKVAEKKVEDTPLPSKPVECFVNEPGQKCLCFDMYTGRYFMSSKQLINEGLNNANADLMRTGYLSLNDFYYYIGLDQATVGVYQGWTFDEKQELIAISFTSVLKDGETPVLAFRFETTPNVDEDYRY